MGVSTNQKDLRRNAKTSSDAPRPSLPSLTQSSTNKPAYHKIGKNSLKKIKFFSKSCKDASKQERVFLKLDPKNSQHAHKIQQRRKAITKGKNTIGYDIYRRTIPIEKRQKRSMVTPSTPDHTLDIPNKKWNGMVRSWRVALHRYDPVDLQQSFAAAQEAAMAERKKVSQSALAGADDTILSTKEKEIADSGIMNLVQVSTNDGTNDSGDQNLFSQAAELLSPTRMPSLTGAPQSTPVSTTEDGHSGEDHRLNKGGILCEFNRWESVRQESEDASFFSREDDDSDDDLL